MKLFAAHYPSLEKAFLNYVHTKRTSLLDPWLVVCSSSLLAKRLASVLTQEQGVIANIYFVTAGTLLRTLDSEAGPALPEFPQDHLRDFLLKEILAEPGLNRYPVSRGFVQALKASLRDLADSLADPDVLEEHLRTTTDPALEQDTERLLWLTRVYRRYLEREAQVPGFRSYQSFFERALEQVKHSAYLKKFSHIVWYGFYDMPGRQLEFVRQIKSYYPLTVFAPYAPVPAYRFARKFFETNWLGGAEVQPVDKAPEGVLEPVQKYLFATQGSAPVQRVQIVPAADPSGEVFFVAKEILKLVETQGFEFKDIAVLARNTTPYQEEVRRVFAQNYIPLNAAFNYPLAKFPLGVFCLNLFSLLGNGFDREMVLAILSSPYFKAAEKRKWHALATRSLASRDLNQWRDLLPITEGFDPLFLRWLETCNTQLTQLNSPAPWAQGVQSALQFLQENVDQNALRGKEQEVFAAVCSCICSLENYASIRPDSKPGEFINELVSALNALNFDETEAMRQGVSFTDVQRARGLSFKVVFILGMTEKSFPLFQAEDPILRDRYRYILRDILGFWMNQQAERADEERLLFFTAITCAQERLYACYARTDEAGKQTVPSFYVAELARACELAWKADQTAQISGRISERTRGIAVEFLTPKEVSYACIFAPQTAQASYQAAGLLTPEKTRALQTASTLRQFGALTPRDGVITSGAEIFDRINRGGGFSASALAELAACPIKFFFHKGLHLEETEEVLSRRELAADKRGSAYHEVLQSFYQRLLDLGLTHQLFDSGVEVYIKEALEKRYTLSSGKLFGIYPLVWELLLEEMQTQLTEFAAEDIKNLGDDTPSLFEKEFSSVRVERVPFALRGIIDRIDLNDAAKTFKVVDYKSSKKGGSDLAKAFFTHLIFQPVLYVLAAEKLPELVSYTCAGSCLLSIRKQYCKRALSADELAALRPLAVQFFSKLAEFINQGQFVLNPSDLCAYCSYRTICRKDHFSSLMRARKSAPGRQLEEMKNV